MRRALERFLASRSAFIAGLLIIVGGVFLTVQYLNRAEALECTEATVSGRAVLICSQQLRIVSVVPVCR